MAPLHNLFHVPLLVEAFAQLQQLEQDLQSITFDTRTWQIPYICNSYIYKSTKAYRVLIGNKEIHSTFKWTWRSSYEYKHSLFLFQKTYLLAHENLSEGITWRSPLIIVSYEYNLLETLKHLLLKCDFAQAVGTVLIVLTPRLNILSLWNVWNSSWMSFSTWKLLSYRAGAFGILGSERMTTSSKE